MRIEPARCAGNRSSLPQPGALVRAWTIATALAATLATGTPAALADPLVPYDGRKPFRCTVQDVGTETDFPAPKADPFCVRFDKTNQDLLGLGVLDFLAQEPARVAAAAGKCFYFQRDEWLGSVLADGELETYHWKGRYFFDLARGAGGVFVRDVRTGGYGGDPSWAEMAPEPLRSFLHPTGGGGYARFDQPVDPACAARVDTRRERRHIYRRWYR